MSETILFVGGSKDGEKQTVINLLDEFQFRIPAVDGGNTYFNIERYLRRTIHSKSGGRMLCCAIFLISTENPDNLIPLLFRGYRRK